ncbi:hypothetical protein D1871_21305 [Nakamurella silvestris]|nr:hypothetical protein D1871_21305 [Nakamurella silvestris]
MQRGRTAAGLLAVASICAALVVSSAVGDRVPTATAAPVAAVVAATPVTVVDGDRSLTVDPASDLAAVNAPITVSGTGFDTDHGLYLAVCKAGFKKSQDLSSCIGGSVPSQNGTTSWAWITDDPDAEGAITWGEDGSFSLTLNLAAAAGDSVDCQTQSCAVYARSDAEKPKDRANDLTVPVAFVPAVSTSTSTSTSTSATSKTTPTSRTTPTTPTTTAESTTEQSTTSAETTAPVKITVDGILSDQIQVGAQQTVLFSGFLPEEKVTVTVFSDPKDLGEMTATKEGTLRVQFDITEDLLPGAHILQVVGQTSGASASANFTVLAAPVTSSSEPATTTSAATTTAASSTEATTESSAAATTESSSAPATTAATATTAPPVTDVNKDSNSSKAIWWLLAGLLVVLIVAAVIIWIWLAKRREEQREEERLLREEELAEAAAAQEAQTELMDTTGPRTFQSPRVPADDHGLLSGRAPGDGPALYSGQGPQGPIPAEEARTQFIPLPDPATEQIPPAPVEPIEHEDNYGLFTHQGDPGTEQIRPETEEIRPGTDDPAAGRADSGPGTAQWRPDFDDDPDDEIPPAPPGTWTPPPKR